MLDKEWELQRLVYQTALTPINIKPGTYCEHKDLCFNVSGLKAGRKQSKLALHKQ